MRQVIDGRLYDTDESMELGTSFSTVCISGGRHIGTPHSRVRLFRTKKGAYFLAHAGMDGEGNVSDPVWLGSIEEANARIWVEKNCPTDAYIKAFGQPESA